MNQDERRAVNEGRMHHVSTTPADDENVYLHQTTMEEDDDGSTLPMDAFIKKYRGVVVSRKAYYSLCKKFVTENAHRYEAGGE